MSFNDGDLWQPLQNNMPVTSVRDIVVHGEDLAIATHGRGFWVMDQIAPLREIATQGPQIDSSAAWLFKPGETIAVRAGGMNGTPLPHEEPQEMNPPSGVLVYYNLKAAAAKPLKLELLDPAGAVRSCAASDTPVRPVDTEAINVQAYWEAPARLRLRPRRVCIGSLWAEPRGVAAGWRFGRGAAAAPATRCLYRRGSGAGGRRRTRARRPWRRRGWWGPGRRSSDGGRYYTVRLTVDGQTYSQPAIVKADPRGTPGGH